MCCFNHCPWSWNSYWQWRHYAVSCVAHSIWMFCCATTAPQHQTFSFRLCFIRWSCRQSCHVQFMATQLSHAFVHPSSVDFSQCSMLPPDWYMWHIVFLRLRNIFTYLHRSPWYEHVTSMLRDLHWLRSLERIDYKLAVLVYRCLHGLAPRYLSDHIQFVVNSNRLRLWSSSSLQLVIRRTQLFTVGDRALPVPGCRLWNSLPPDVTSASSLTVFQNCLKTYLIFRSFPS